MSLDATEIMRATMDTCLRFISGDMPLSKEEVSYQVNSFFQAAKEIQNMIEQVLSMEGTSGSNINSEEDVVGEHKFQVQEEIELLRQEVANKDIIIAKIGEKTLEWEERFLKLKQEQHNELRAI
eukprot:Phypoly_transcript_19592.p1 GENE.Phypoly_transcript_19592~~Phypoly_transcript_19592.p1  ORF type:complete len:124 (+),score=26.92 Phypoly_transcript_19592:107-478(+)